MSRSALPRLFVAMIAAAPFVLLPAVRDFANLPQLVWLQVGTCALLLLYAGCPSPSGAMRSFDRPLLAIGGWCLLTGAWAHNRYEWCEDILLGGTGAAVYFLSSRLLETEGERRGLLRALAVSGALMATVGLAQYVFGLDALPQVSPPAATFASRNVAAGVGIVLFPIAAAALLTTARPQAAVVPALASTLLLAFIFHTSVRSAWLAAAVELIALAVAAVRAGRLRGGRWRSGFIAAALACAVLLASVGPRGMTSPTDKVAELSAQTLEGHQGSAEKLDAPDKTRSVSLRLAVWRDSLRLIAAHPLVGVGVGNFKVQLPAHSRAMLLDAAGRPFLVDYAHDEYLQATAETGLIGLALVGWLLLAAVPQIFAALRAPADPATLAAAVGLLGLGIDSVFSFPLHRAVIACLGATFLGLLSVPANTARPSSRPRRRTIAAVLGLALLLVATWSLARIAADRHLRRMALAADAGDWGLASREGARARRLNPFHSLALFPMASAEIHRGHSQGAIEILQAIVGDYPYHANAWGNLAIAHLAAGHAHDARVCFEHVLALRPSDDVAREQLRRLGAEPAR